MEIVATQKYLRMSPQKLRLITRTIKRIDDPEKLLTVLAFMGKRAAKPILKTVKQALANARNRGVSSALLVKEIQIGDGPRLRRFRAGPRGMAHPILKRTSHIRVVLEAAPIDNEKIKNKKSKSQSKV